MLHKYKMLPLVAVMLVMSLSCDSDRILEFAKMIAWL